MSDAELDYFPSLIAAFEAGHASDHVHLGYWPAGARYGWAEAQEAMARLHLDRAGMHDGMALLDVGCGIGGTLRLADGLVGGSTLTGLNIDLRQLAVCHRLASRRNRFDWVEGDACALPFLDQSFDAVVSLEAMFHFADRGVFLAEAARVLRPGGRLVVSDIRFDPTTDARTGAALELVCAGYAPWPEPSPHKNLESLAAAAGLTPIESLDLTAPIAPSWDVIAPSDDSGPPAHPVAAMALLHRRGLMHYPLLAAGKG